VIDQRQVVKTFSVLDICFRCQKFFSDAGLPDGLFQTKNPNLGKFWRALDWKMLIYFMPIWNILQTFGIFYNHLLHFVFTWYIFSGFGIMYQEKSGNSVPLKRYHIIYWALL
jgi:hypothetical protein